MRPTLDELALKHDTDKSSVGHGYTRLYQRLFEPLRDQPVKFLELGVWHGASLRMWDDYFTHGEAEIIGVDRDSVDQTFGPRVRVCHGDQTEIPLDLRGLTGFDVIIDDASHQSSKTIASFITWWPRLRPGGFYVIEDITTSYYAGSPEACVNPEHKPQNHYRATAMQWFKRLTDQVNSWAYPSHFQVGDFQVASVSFYPNLALVEKAQ